MNLSSYIKEKRIEKGLTQTELAQILNVDRSLVSKWETGKAEPQEQILEALAKALNISDIDSLRKSDRKNSSTTELKAIIRIDNNLAFQIISLLVMCLSILIGPWGFFIDAFLVYYAFKKSMPVWIKILSILVALFLAYQLMYL